MTQNEKNIFDNLRMGDEKAFEYVFNTYYARLYNYAKIILKNNHEAEEVVEETFIKIWENRSKIIIDTSLKSYLFRSVYNLCLNQIKHTDVQNRYKAYFTQHVLSDEHGQFLNNDFPLSSIIEKELENSIEQAIQSLPEYCREIFLMSRYQNLKNEEIAEKLGVSINTVRTQISRALAKLRELLKEYIPFLLMTLLDFFLS